ncbi:MAG: L-serine ammonia-lyase, iron-sulfur-dependent subunit beta [Bacteroidota bacterium]
MPERSSIFDMIGPVMIGPSSSHTGAVVRIGRTARGLFGEQAEKVIITFYNSFSRTYEGHGSDRAILAGLLDMAPDDERIRDSHQHAKDAGLNYHFKVVFNASSLHPNAIRIEQFKGERKQNILGISRGGGIISIKEIDGFTCSFSAQVPTIIFTAKDVHGSIAFITDIIAHEDCNIATMTVDRSGKYDMAKLVLELDSNVRSLTLEYLRSLSWIENVTYLNGNK